MPETRIERLDPTLDRIIDTSETIHYLADGYGGDQGPAVVPGHPEKSLLLKALRHEDANLKMPPSGKLSRQHLDDLARWVKMGAPWPGAANTTTGTRKGGPFKVTEQDRAYWAFRPVQRPPLPCVKDVARVANPIDAFLLAELARDGRRAVGDLLLDLGGARLERGIVRLDGEGEADVGVGIFVAAVHRGVVGQRA